MSRDESPVNQIKNKKTAPPVLITTKSLQKRYIPNKRNRSRTIHGKDSIVQKWFARSRKVKRDGTLCPVSSRTKVFTEYDIVPRDLQTKESPTSPPRFRPTSGGNPHLRGRRGRRGSTHEGCPPLTDGRAVSLTHPPALPVLLLPQTTQTPGRAPLLAVPGPTQSRHGRVSKRPTVLLLHLDVVTVYGQLERVRPCRPPVRTNS